MTETEELVLKTLICGVSATVSCRAMLHIFKHYKCDEIAAIPLISGFSSIVGVGCGIGSLNLYEYFMNDSKYINNEILGAIVPENLEYIYDTLSDY